MLAQHSVKHIIILYKIHLALYFESDTKPTDICVFETEQRTAAYKYYEICIISTNYCFIF